MKKILITFFIIFIFTPLFCLVFNIQDGFKNTEKRNLEEFPKFENVEQFTDGFLKYYEDNFGLRYSFMRLACNLKRKLFKTYPKNIDVKVLKGKDGWLFYKLGNETEDYLGRVPLSEKKLEKIKENLAERRQTLGEKKLYVLIPPDKTVIYSEFLPDNIKSGENLENSRVMQLLNSGENVIYPKNLLLQNKNAAALYFTKDTHWTYLGAYFGYKAVMEEIKKNFKITPLKISDFIKKEYTLQNPDLSAITEIGEETGEKSFEFECKNSVPKSKLKVAVFGDSFMKYLKPFFLCTFENPEFIDSNTIDTKKAESADIVILEIVQRNLRQLEIKDKAQQ